MSFAYGLATRVSATRFRKNGSDDLPKILEIFAALVPAEILAAHGAILAFTTDPTGSGGVQTSAFPVLRFAFWALIAASAFLYAAGREGSGIGRSSTGSASSSLRLPSSAGPCC